MKTKRIFRTALAIAFIFSAIALSAQPPPPPSSGAPIDGGVIVLVIAIVAYGYWQMKKDNAKIKEQIAICESLVYSNHKKNTL